MRSDESMQAISTGAYRAVEFIKQNMKRFSNSKKAVARRSFPWRILVHNGG
jgi:hypothetical protein